MCDHAEIFRSQPDGWKFTAHWDGLDSFDRTPLIWRYTYGGVVKQHGYIVGGGLRGWALHERPGDLPSYRAKVRRYRERRWRWLTLDSVEAIEAGWKESKKNTSTA